MHKSFQEMIAAHRVAHGETPESRQKLADQIAGLREKNASTIAKLRGPKGGKPDADGFDGLTMQEKLALGLAEQLFERSKPAAAVPVDAGERRRMTARIIELDDKRGAAGDGLSPAETAELSRLRHAYAASRVAAA